MMPLSPYPHHVFMDETRFRSANIHYGFDIGLASPGMMSSHGYEDRGGAEYYYTASYHDRDAAWQERLQQIYMEQSGVRWCTDAFIRSTNRRAAIANGAIHLPHEMVDVQPMRSLTGICPPNFAHPTQVRDLLYMANDQLQRIMAAYNLLPGAPPYMFALRHSGFTGPVAHRIANLVALFDYLGAHRIAGQLCLQSV